MASLAFVAACADIATAPIPIVTLRGSVTAPDGEPLAGVQIFFLLAPKQPSPVSMAAPRRAPRPPEGIAARVGEISDQTIPLVLTGLDGTFQLELAVGIYDAYMEAPERSGVRSFTVVRFEVGRVKPRFDYRYGGIEVTGAVTGPGGTPVTNATVAFSKYDEYFEASARFDGIRYTAYLEAGRYYVLVYPPSYVMGLPDITVPNVPIAADTTIDFSLDGHLVTGNVTGPDGSPLPRATVYFGSANAGSGANADDAGRYSLYAPTATYTTYAFPPVTRHDIFSRIFGSVSVAGPATVDLAFTGITWSGVVRAAGTGAPIPGAVVSVVGVDYYGYLGKAESTTAGAGAFKLYLASPQGYWLKVAAPGFVSPDRVEAVAGGDSTFDLTLIPSSAP